MLKVTGFYAAIFGIFQAVLTLSIVFVRVTQKISVGSGGNQNLEFRIRGHGNFIETVPIALILLGVLETQRYVSPFLLNSLAVALLFGRLCHAYSFFFYNGKTYFRRIGMITTVSCIILYSIIILFNSI